AEALVDAEGSLRWDRQPRRERCANQACVAYGDDRLAGVRAEDIVERRNDAAPQLRVRLAAGKPDGRGSVQQRRLELRRLPLELPALDLAALDLAQIVADYR